MSWGASALKAQKKTTAADSAEKIKPIAARDRMFPKPLQYKAVLGRPSSHSI